MLRLIFICALICVANGESLKDNENGSKNKVDDVMLYIDALIHNILLQDWSTNEEECLNQTLQIMEGVKKSELWATWNWDSTSRDAVGVLYGNNGQLGNFDACFHKSWLPSSKDIKMQYCLAVVNLTSTIDPTLRHAEIFNYNTSVIEYLQNYPKLALPYNLINWGSCLPAVCSSQSVAKLLAITVRTSHIAIRNTTVKVDVKEPCQVKVHFAEYDTGFYVIVSLAASIVIITLICSYYSEQSHSSAFKSKILQAFSLTKNSKSLIVNRNKSGDNIGVLYGIRAISMLSIVFGHWCSMSSGSPVGNGVIYDQILKSIVGVFTFHLDVTVDTFYTMSGMLTMTHLMALKKVPNPIYVIAFRYIRIAANFAAVICFMAFILPHCGSGPLWPTGVEMESNSCRRNWWLSLLMVANYVNTNDMCMLVTWYIPSDFHLYLVIVALYYIYQVNKRLAWLLGLLISAASIIVPGVVNYVNEEQPTQIFTREFSADPRNNKLFHSTYMKTHMRMAAYIVGVALGYYMTKYRPKEGEKLLSKKWSTLGAAIGSLVMIGMIVLGPVLLVHPHPLTSAVFAALNRPIFCMGLALFVVCCTFGTVPFITAFLSWEFWIPLSRLSFGLYLTHSPIILRNLFSSRRPMYYVDIITELSEALPAMVWGTLAAFMLWLFIEAPTKNIFIVLCTPRKKFTYQETNKSVYQEPNIQTINANDTNFTLNMQTNNVNINDNGHILTKF